MNSRERVLTAFKKLPGLPDRVPIQFDLCRQLSDYFAQKLFEIKNLGADILGGCCGTTPEHIRLSIEKIKATR
jgi:methionine synthase I (cobalamin-dependent)